ncbi:XVIPCD domain-containing protein, partial [Rhodanobacter lindaniclasticus]
RHPDHLLYQQALAGVHRVDAQLGRHPDTHSENLAVALTVAARRQDLDRIDQVMLSGDGERAFVLQDGLWARMAHVQTADAVRTSVIDSSVAWTQAHQQAACLNSPMPVPAAASTPTNVHAIGR